MKRYASLILPPLTLAAIVCSTAITIATSRQHVRFNELSLQRSAFADAQIAELRARVAELEFHSNSITFDDETMDQLTPPSADDADKGRRGVVGPDGWTHFGDLMPGESVIVEVPLQFNGGGSIDGETKPAAPAHEPKPI